MRTVAPAIVAIVLCAALVGLAYLTIKPAFHVAMVSVAAIALFLHGLEPAKARSMMSRVLITAIGLPILAWSLTNVWLLYLVMLLWVPVVAGRLAFAAPVYLYSLLLLPGLDQPITLGSIKLFDFGVHDALALGAAFVVASNAGKAKLRLRWDAPALAVMLLLGAALARDTTMTHFLRVTINVMLDLGLPYYIVSRGIRTAEEFRAAMLWLACGAVTLSAILIYEAWKAWPIYNLLYDIYDLPTLLLVKSRGGLMRAGGPFVESTSAAMVLATCFLALWLSRDGFRSRHSYLLCFVVALIGLSAPQSRGAWIGLFVAMAAAQVFRGRYSRLLLSSVAIGIGGAFLVMAAQFSPFLSENLGLSGGSSATSEYRRLLFDRGIEEFWHSPFWGFSMPEVTARLSDLRQGEGIVDFVNAYIWILLISGVVGVAIFLGSFLCFLLPLLRLRRPETDIVPASFAFAGLAMPLEMLFFTSFGGRPAFFIFVLFGFAAALINMRERRREAPGLEAGKATPPGQNARAVYNAPITATGNRLGCQ